MASRTSPFASATGSVMHTAEHGKIAPASEADDAIGYRVCLEDPSDQANSGRILPIVRSINPTKYNRLGLTDRARFQDHRHRPLGHPSASTIRPEFARISRSRLARKWPSRSPDLWRNLPSPPKPLPSAERRVTSSVNLTSTSDGSLIVAIVSPATTTLNRP